MKNRSVVMVIVLGLITFGIYQLIWLYQTKEEMVTSKRVDSAPSLWWLLVPFVGGLIFLWKYSEIAEKVTNGKYSQIIIMVMFLFIGFIASGILQAAYNEVGEGGSNASSDPFGANA